MIKEKTIKIILASLVLVIPGCGVNRSDVPLPATSGPTAAYAGTDTFSGMSFPKLEDIKTEEISELGAIHTCSTTQYGNDGLTYRKMTNLNLNLNYISIKYYLPTEENFYNPTYTFNGKTNTPTPYWYLGGVGATTKGVPADAGLAYSNGLARPYIQVRSDNSTTGKPIALPTQQVFNLPQRNPDGTVKYNADGTVATAPTTAAIRIPIGQPVDLAFYVDKTNSINLTVNAPVMLYLDVATGRMYPWVGGAVKYTYNKSSDARIKDWGWSWNSTGTNTNGQTLKFNVTLAYNDVNSTFISGRRDYFYGTSFETPKVAKVTGWNSDGTPNLASATYYTESQWKAPTTQGVYFCKSKGTRENTDGSVDMFTSTDKPDPIKKQSFEVTDVQLKSVTNSTASSEVALQVNTSNTSVKGSFQIVQAGGVFFSPSGGPNSRTNSIAVAAKCGNTPGTQPSVTALVYDPDGYTTFKKFSVVVTCNGPKPKIYTTSPAPITALIGETKSTTFDISNSGDPGSTLTYTLSPSSGLSLSKNSGSLVKSTGPTAADPKETITASYACTTAGIVTPAPTVTIKSNDPNRPSVVETVNVECKAVNPKISEPILNSNALTAFVGNSAYGYFTFSNIGDPGSVLTYTLSSSSPNISFIPDKTYLYKDDSTATNFSYACNVEGNFAETITITSNDPSSPTKTIRISVTCITPKAVIQVSATSVTAPGSVTITNTGNILLRFQTRDGQGYLETHIFSWLYMWDAYGLELQPGQSITLNVSHYCNPNVPPYTDSGVMNISSNDPDRPEITVGLIGPC